MQLNAPDLSLQTRSAIERAIRAPADRPVELQGLVTTDLPTAADYPFSFVFDTTLGQPKFSDGTNWLTFSLSTHTHTSFGALTITGLVTLSGGQIAFPATQVPSSDANTLDDYEEGTWTPTLQFGGGSVGMGYDVRSGTYTKIGRMVFIQAAIILNSKGSSTGNATIAGLPFTVGSSATAAIGLNLATTVAVPLARAEAGQTYMALIDFTGSGLSSLTHANFNNNSQVNTMALSYPV